MYYVELLQDRHYLSTGPIKAGFYAYASKDDVSTGLWMDAERIWFENEHRVEWAKHRSRYTNTLTDNERKEFLWLKLMAR